RPSGRTHRRPQRPISTPLSPKLLGHIAGLLAPVRSRHHTPPKSRCCDDQLNPPFNPVSVWSALQMGARIIWMPTIDALAHRRAGLERPYPSRVGLQAPAYSTPP